MMELLKVYEKGKTIPALPVQLLLVMYYPCVKIAHSIHTLYKLHKA